MKQIQHIYIFFISCLISIFHFSCSDENESTVSGKGVLSIDLGLDTSVLTRSVEKKSDEITLKIQRIDIENSPAMYYSYSDLGTYEYPLEAGRYELIVTIGNDEQGKPTTTPYYVGRDTIPLISGQTESVTITCKLTTSVIKVDYSQIAGVYEDSDYKTEISNKDGYKIEFEKDNNIAGYFVPDILSVVFIYDNGRVELDPITDLKPQYEYVIEYKLKESEGGDSSGSAGIGVIVDENPEEGSGIITIEFPKLTASFDNIDVDLHDLKAYINATYFATSGIVLGDDALEYSQLENGIEGSWQDLYINRNDKNCSAVFDLEPNKKYKVRFKKNHEVFKTFSTSLVEYEPINDFNIWASFVRDVKVKYNEEADTFKYQYREVWEVGETEWKDSSSTLEAEGQYLVSSLKIDTIVEYKPTYEYRLVALKENISIYGNKESFIAERARQLPNASFENWQKPGNPYLIYGENEEKFWDSGNEGATTLNKDGSVTTPNNEDPTYIHSGETSAKLASRNVVVKFAAGNLFAGEYVDTDGTDGILDFGRPFESRPSKLRLWHKYISSQITYPSGGWLSPFPSEVIAMGTNRLDADMEHIYIAIGDWDEPVRIRTKSSVRKLFDKDDPNIIAYGEHISNQSTASEGLEELTIELVYRDLERKPKYIVIVCSASRFGDYFAGGTSVLYLDDFELIYDDSPVTE